MTHEIRDTGATGIDRGATQEMPVGRYLHFKGKPYEVLHTAQHCDTGESFVVYRALYGDFGVWIRPLAEFTETVTRDGITAPRFQRVLP